jgi:hypothetical protein
VRFPGFNFLYVRHTQRYIRGEIASPVLDLANIEAKKPGKGAFTKLFLHLRKTYPEYWLYAESVLNPRFEKKLLELGFTQVSEGIAPSFYMTPSKEKTDANTSRTPRAFG